MQQNTVTVEELAKEIKDAIEYGKALGYTECLNKTIGKLPESSFAQQAANYYVKSIVENYSKD